MRRLVAVALVSILELWRRRDVYVALVLAAAVVVPLSAVKVFGVGGVNRYVREVTLLLIWCFIAAVSVTTAARQIPSEIQRRTILPLLAKPVRRCEVVLGKFVGATLACWGALLLFYACYVLLIGLKSGVWISAAAVQGFILHLCFVALVVAMTLCGSLVLTPSANITCSLLVVGGMLLYGNRLSALARGAAAPLNWLLWLSHAVLPHFEFFDLRLRLVHAEWGPLSGRAFLCIVGYAVLYGSFFLVGAVAAFRRKRL
jgi:ABC-type transport system involved in multi-copper enzyme maturation permease subunit